MYNTGSEVRMLPDYMWDGAMPRIREQKAQSVLVFGDSLEAVACQSYLLRRPKLERKVAL